MYNIDSLLCHSKGLLDAFGIRATLNTYSASLNCILNTKRNGLLNKLVHLYNNWAQYNTLKSPL